LSQAATIFHSGAVSGSPVNSPCGPTLSDTLRTDFQGTYGASKSSRMVIVGATDAVPYVVTLDSVVKIRFLALRVINGASIKALLTSASGSVQALKTSSLLLWHSPNSGDEITAIKLVGTADIELMIAGDTT
jgi:hypothetical protein